MALPSLYQYLATPALDMSVEAVTAKTASIEDFDPNDIGALHVPTIDAGSALTHQRAETYDDDHGIEPLAVPSNTAETSPAEGKATSPIRSIESRSPTPAHLSTMNTRSDTETFDDDPGLGALSTWM